jgi:glutamine amidotransferase-like uncharacterized protein
MKHFLAAGIILMICLTIACGGASAGKITVDGEDLAGVTTITRDGRTLVPLRSIFEALGATVTYDADSKEITASKGETRINLWVGSRVVRVNGQSQTIDVPAQVVAGRVFVPVRFVSNALDADVRYNSQTEAVTITTTSTPGTGQGSGSVTVPADGYVLIYNGEEADPYGSEAVAKAAGKLGYQVQYIADLQRLPEMLKGARAFVIGGTIGDTGEILRKLRPVQGQLKQFIAGGGRYLGICGGAYIASQGSQWEDGYETGLSLVALESFEYDPEYDDPQIIQITWAGQKRSIYYLNGPAFKRNDLPPGANALAEYADQRIAAFIATSGQGKIALCGPHPEADRFWLYDDPPPRRAGEWTETWDLMLSMFRQLMTS